MIFLASGPLLNQPPPPGSTLGTMNIQNCQILIQLLTLQAKIGLQTKFEANRAKNDILGLWAPSWAPPGAPLGLFWELLLQNVKNQYFWPLLPDK